jgi:hypothetical protein
MVQVPSAALDQYSMRRPNTLTAGPPDLGARSSVDLAIEMALSPNASTILLSGFHEIVVEVGDELLRRLDGARPTMSSI